MFNGHVSDQNQAENAQLTTLIHKHEANEREKFIRSLMLGSIRFNPKIAAELGVKLSRRHLSVILVRINITDDMPISDIPSIMFAIRNIGEELYGEYSDCYGVEVDTITMGFISSHGADSSFITEQSSDLKRHVVELFNVKTTLSMCNSSDCTPADINNLFNNAKYAMLYRLSFKPYSIIDYDKTRSMSRSSCEYPAILEREIFDCVQSRNLPMLKRAVGSFVNEIDNTSYDTIVLHGARLLIGVQNMIINSGQEYSIHNSIIEQVSALESIDDLAVFVEEKCIEAANILAASKTEAKKDFIVTTVLNFINEKYADPTLSIEVIATSVKRSSNYIRSVFKESQGISISEYLANKRFDQVCKMLIETNLTARDIGKAVGLNSGSYFYTAFKKYTGCTPDTYRKNHRLHDK